MGIIDNPKLPRDEEVLPLTLPIYPSGFALKSRRPLCFATAASCALDESPKRLQLRPRT